MKKLIHIWRWLFDDEFKFYKYHDDAIAYECEFRNYRGQKQYWDSSAFTTVEIHKMQKRKNRE